MSDHITLLGVEDMRQASRNITDAADIMKRAADQIDESLRYSLNRFEELVERLEVAMAAKETK